jgi:muconolactone delta-isomerase
MYLTDTPSRALYFQIHFARRLLGSERPGSEYSELIFLIKLMNTIQDSRKPPKENYKSKLKEIHFITIICNDYTGMVQRETTSCETFTTILELQIFIPQSMQADMLTKIHVNHLGAKSNIQMAREVLFWRGIWKAIQNMCNTCGIFAQSGQTLTKEAMKSLPILSLSWEITSQYHI